MQTKLPSRMGVFARASLELTTSMEWILLCIAALALFFQLALRIHVGIDLTDESWYLAMPLRLARGDHPYIDEIFLMQGFALLLAPFVKLYLLVVGSTDRLILSSRIAYVVMSVSIAFTVFRLLRQAIDILPAGLIALSMTAFFPYGIPNFSYNTLGLAFLTLTSISAATAATATRPAAYWFVGGMTLAAGALVHPSLLSLFGVFGLLSVLGPTARNPSPFRQWPNIAAITGGAILFWLGVGVLYGVTPTQVVENYRLTVEMNSAFSNSLNVDKALRVASGLFSAGPFDLPWLFLVIGLTLFSARVGIAHRFLLAAALIPAAFYFSRERLGGLGPHGFLIFIGFMAPYFWAQISRSTYNCTSNRLLLYLWLPAVIHGVSTSMTSYNGASSAATPFVLASVATLSLLVLWITQSKKHDRFKAVAVVPCVLVLVFFGYYQWTSIYREDLASKLNSKIESGPFQGLLTSQEKVNYLSEFQSLLSPEKAPSRVVFYPFFPAGYLFLAATPGLPTTWGCMGLSPSVCVDYAQKHFQPGDMWVRVNRVMFNSTSIQDQSATHPLDAFIQTSDKTLGNFKRVVPRF